MSRIFGIGTDIVSVTRMERSLARFGRRLAQRLLSADELLEFDASTAPVQLLAKRFAVKEATAKAFGTGFRDGLKPGDIEVGHNRKGRPELIYRGRAQVLARDWAIEDSFVSIADEREFAVAYVVLTQRDSP